MMTKRKTLPPTHLGEMCLTRGWPSLIKSKLATRDGYSLVARNNSGGIFQKEVHE